jgi:hypothetical protein
MNSREIRNEPKKDLQYPQLYIHALVYTLPHRIRNKQDRTLRDSSQSHEPLQRAQRNSYNFGILGGETEEEWAEEFFGLLAIF